MKQQDRLRLKAHVNTVVTNIAPGIANLYQTSQLLLSLKDLENKSDYTSIKDKLKCFSDLALLATVYERLFKYNPIIIRIYEDDKLFDKVDH